VLYEAYFCDDATRGFMAEYNPAALAETRRRFAEAIECGPWRPRSNSAREALAQWSAPMSGQAEQQTPKHRGRRRHR
jgi:cobaltochelatase CobN